MVDPHLMAKHIAIMLEDYDQVIPDTILETRLGDGEVVNRIPVPGKTFHYKKGEECKFSKKADLLAFLRAMNGKAQAKP
jgi:hypothetical protein